MLAPALWDALNLSFEYGEPDKWVASHSLEGISGAIDAWIPRAKARPLHLALNGMWEVKEEEHLRPLLRSLEAFAPRVKELNLGLLDIPEFTRLQTVKPVFSALVELSLSLDHDDELFDDDIALGFFHDAPCLRKVHLFEFPFDAVALPYEKIEEFGSYRRPAIECLHALTHLPNLIHCHLTPTLHDFPRANLITVTHPRIQHLALMEDQVELEGLEDELDEFEWPIHMINLLTLPALESLKINSTSFCDFSSQDLYQFLNAPSLRFGNSFSPTQPWASDAQDIDSLDAFLLLTRLEELEIHNPSQDWVALLAAKFADDSDGNFLPQLQTLTIYSGTKTPVEFVETVRKLGAALLVRHRALRSLRIVATRIAFTNMPCRDMADAILPLFELKERRVDVHAGTADVSAI
ncbi:F-box domain-containing protein [Mycena kentingensis (nom. inval.)]|nr:F-box domain-containing protein [Mycena kentingensis (nom. inval.)]